MSSTVRFWEQKELHELSQIEWELLCDGCGRCCLNKLEDEDTGEVHFTDIACKLLNTESCQCNHYSDRFSHVPDCLQVRDLLLPSEDGSGDTAAIDEQKLSWLPRTCAYVKLFHGEKLAEWHPLISGDPDTVQAAGIGVGGRCVSETKVPLNEWEHHLIVFAE